MSSKKHGRWFYAPHYLIRVDPHGSSPPQQVLTGFTICGKRLKISLTWSTHSYTTIEGGNVPAEEIEAAKRTLDERTFRQEYLASFETLTGRVYPDFGIDNISDDVKDTGGEILLGCDFNVGVMAGVLGSRVGDTLHIWDEVALKQSNTDEMCMYLQKKFPHREIVAYPDPTGSARKTSAAGETDHGIIRKYGFKCISPKQTPGP